MQQSITKHGPTIAEVVGANEITFHAFKEQRTQKLKTGQHIYIAPDTAFYFSSAGNTKASTVLFEIR